MAEARRETSSPPETPAPAGSERKEPKGRKQPKGPLPGLIVTGYAIQVPLVLTRDQMIQPARSGKKNIIGTNNKEKTGRVKD